VYEGDWQALPMFLDTVPELMLDVHCAEPMDARYYETDGGMVAEAAVYEVTS